MDGHTPPSAQLYFNVSLLSSKVRNSLDVLDLGGHMPPSLNSLRVYRGTETRGCVQIERKTWTVRDGLMMMQAGKSHDDTHKLASPAKQV